MRNPDLNHLREAVRGEIAHAFEAVGFAKPREIARLVCAGYPENILAMGGRLAEDALTDLARRELKNTTQGRGSTSQMRLPGVPAALAIQLPPAISIPAGEGADDEGVIYKPLAQVTFEELKAHLGMLSNQITADTRRHRALTELYDMALARGATPAAGVFEVLGANQYVEQEVA